MARSPITRFPLPLELPTSSGDDVSTPVTNPAPSGENHDAVQDHLPRTDQGTSATARAAAGEQDAAAGAGRLRDRAEGEPRAVADPLQRSEPPQGPQPAFERSPGDGDRGVAGKFTLRTGRTGGRAVLP